MQDMLAHLIRGVRVSRSVFLDIRFADPWAMAVPRGSRLAGATAGDERAVVHCHLPVEGRCWVHGPGPDEAAFVVPPGGVVVFPHGDPHLVASDPALPAAPDRPRYPDAADASGMPSQLDFGRCRPACGRIICGTLFLEPMSVARLIPLLPRVLHRPARGEGSGGCLGHLVDATVHEATERAPGAGGVLTKLAELMFVEAVRRDVILDADGDRCWGTAPGEGGVDRAIALLRNGPARPWTLADLARESGLSRTVLSERFTRVVGTAPMAYLAERRMEVAGGLLRDGHDTIERVAHAVGYGSEAAFSRAFKRSTGLSPARWRADHDCSA